MQLGCSFTEWYIVSTNTNGGKFVSQYSCLEEALIYVTRFFWGSLNLNITFVSNPAYKSPIFCFPNTVGYSLRRPYTPAAYKSSPPLGLCENIPTFNVRPINCRPPCIRPAKYIKLFHVTTTHL